MFPLKVKVGGNIYQVWEFWRGGVHYVFKALSHKCWELSQRVTIREGLPPSDWSSSERQRDRPIYYGNSFERAVVAGACLVWKFSWKFLVLTPQIKQGPSFTPLTTFTALSLNFLFTHCSPVPLAGTAVLCACALALSLSHCSLGI